MQSKTRSNSLSCTFAMSSYDGAYDPVSPVRPKHTDAASVCVVRRRKTPVAALCRRHSSDQRASTPDTGSPGVFQILVVVIGCSEVAPRANKQHHFRLSDTQLGQFGSSRPVFSFPLIDRIIAYVLLSS